MARPSRARREAVLVLGDVRRRGAHARDVLRSSKRLVCLDQRERAQVTRLVLGVVGSVGLLDATLDSHLRKGAHLEPKVRDAMRLSTFELLFLSTPSSVAVSQGVELARSASTRAAGLANAVLRRVAQDDVPLREVALERVRQASEEEGDLELVSGYPTWLLSRVKQERGAEVARSFAMSANEPAPMYVAVNRARASEEEALELLRNAGLGPQATNVPGAYLLRTPADLHSCGLVQDAIVAVSDLSAQRIARSVVKQRHGRLLEVGQGRGTKSILMCSAARQEGLDVSIVGVDTEAFKVKVAQDRMKRANLADVVRCVQLDATQLRGVDVGPTIDDEYDAVFVDAPCSGTGTLRRHPEIAWSVSRQDVRELSRLQERLLEASSSRVARGGILGYATCSVLRDENSAVVDDFLLSPAGSGFELVGEPFASSPEVGMPDGHFCALMVRV